METRATARPSTEVLPGLHRVALPLSGSPLGQVNAYLIEDGAGLVLIDTGWRTPETIAALEAAFAGLGRTPADLQAIVLTHAHPDHCGLAAQLRALSGAPIALHPADAPLADPARRWGEVFMRKSAAWFARHGMPEDEQGGVRRARQTLVERNPPFVPDRALADGEELALGPFRFRVLWCPGHAPGQVCLHEERAGFLIAGDHVLPHISPNVGSYTGEEGDPLGDFLDSLARVREVPVDRILPGHGEPFAGLAARVDELAAHHEARLSAIRALLEDGPAMAFALCARLSWAGGRIAWPDLPPFQHALALAETIAHLETLRRRGLATRLEEGDDDGAIRYAHAG